MLALVSFFGTHLSVLCFLAFLSGLWLDNPVLQNCGGIAIALLALQSNWDRATNAGLLAIAVASFFPGTAPASLHIGLLLLAADLLIEFRLQMSWLFLVALAAPAALLFHPPADPWPHALAALIAALVLLRPEPHPWLPAGALALQWSLFVLHFQQGPIAILYHALFLYLFGYLASSPKPVIRELDTGPSRTLRIAHLSDIHFPSSDPVAAEDLLRKLVELNPHIVVLSGDLLNSPHAGWSPMLAWLKNLRESLKLHPSHVLTIPGNHDMFFTGLSGLSPVAQQLFNSRLGLVSPDHLQAPIFYCPRSGVAFLLLDLNPIHAIFSAEGKVYKHRLARLTRLLQSDPRLRSAAKILVTHHHPLPVPHEGGDFLLATRGVHHLQRFCSEHHIDIVLHGHKHFATWSHLRLGGGSKVPFLLEILGAGAAFHKNDNDRRGANFNFLTISSSGARHIRQFFRLPGSPGYLEAEPSPIEALFASTFLRKHAARMHSEKISWHLEIDSQGNSNSVYTVSGICSNRPVGPYELRLPETEVLSGTPSDYYVHPSSVRGSLRRRFPGANDSEWVFTFDDLPQARLEDKLVLNSHEHAYFILNANHARESESAHRRFPGFFRDFLYFELTDSTDCLELSLQFPSGAIISNFNLRAMESGGAPVHGRLSSLVHNCCPPNPVNNGILVSIPDPVPNFRYFLEWDIAISTSASGDDLRDNRQRVFEQQLQASALSGQDILGRALALFAETVVVDAGAAIGIEAPVSAASGIDLSCMVRRPADSAQPAQLVALCGYQLNIQLDRYSLKTGQGNSGAAYRGFSIRSYDADKAASDPASNVYLPIPGDKNHRFLLSVPVIDDDSTRPVAVLSIGAFSDAAADRLRSTSNPAVQQRILEHVSERVYPLLLKAAGMQPPDVAPTFTLKPVAQNNPGVRAQECEISPHSSSRKYAALEGPQTAWGRQILAGMQYPPSAPSR